MSTNRRKRMPFHFAEYHDSLLCIENACHNIGIAVRLYETINDRFEKAVVVYNSKTETPVKTVILEGKTPWQAIKDVIQEIPEEYGYESPEAYPKAVRELVLRELKERDISLTDLAQKTKQSLSLVSYTLSGKRKSTHVMTKAAAVLGYESLDALIKAANQTLLAASRGKEGAV